MNTTSTLKAITLVAALTAIGSVSARENILEPCLNGEVSASGLYPSQAIEDAVRTSGMSLDASLNGQVSASGLYPTQEMEDAALGIVRADSPVDGIAARVRSATPGEEEADVFRLSNPVAVR